MKGRKKMLQKQQQQQRRQQQRRKQQRKQQPWLPLSLLLLAVSFRLLPGICFADEACTTTAQTFDFQALWLFQIYGATLLTESFQLRLEAEIMDMFQCEDEESESFYELTAVAVRTDLLDSLFLVAEQEDAAAAASGIDDNTLVVPVAVQGVSNLAALEGPGAVLLAFSEDDRRLEYSLRRRDLQDCTCFLPTKAEFLQDLGDRLGIQGGDGFDVTEMEEIDCPAANLTSFSAGIAVDVIGNVDLISNTGLAVYTQAVIEWWNTLNFYENCDETNARLISGIASVDPESIVRGIASGMRELEGDEDERQPEGQRQLQNDTSFPPSASPSNSSSLAPSLSPTMTSSTLPTFEPTSRGPDLFRLLISLTGVCRGCPTETNLFLQVTAGGSRNLKEKQQQQQQETSHSLHRQRHPSRFLSHNNSSFAPGECFCPVGAPEGQGIVQEKFFQAVNREISEEADFVDDVVTIEEVDVFPCQQDNFVSYATMVFTGEPELIEAGQIEGIFLNTFNRQAELGCDPLVRSLEKVELLRLGLLENTGSPSSHPSSAPTSVPSETPSEDPSNEDVRARRKERALMMESHDDRVARNKSGNVKKSILSKPGLTYGRNLETNDTAVPTNSSSVPSEQPSSQPIATAQPTDAPTAKGPDLFYLLFELTGTCNGCGFESNFFDQLTFGSSGGRRLRRNNRQTTSRRGPALRFLAEQGLCACEPDAEQVGVPLDDFVEDFQTVVSEEDVPGVEDVSDATELETLPPTTFPTVSLVPSNTPSEMPSSGPSSQPTSAPSEMPSEVPSSGPSPGPSSQPTSTPSEMPSEVPSLGPSGSNRPSSSAKSLLSGSLESQSPIPSSMFPSEYPSEFPSSVHSSTPSTSIAPSITPSVLPSGSGAPSSVPSKSPSFSIVPSIAPSPSPSGSIPPSSQPSLSPSSSVMPSSSPGVCFTDNFVCDLPPTDGDLQVEVDTGRATVSCPDTSPGSSVEYYRQEYDMDMILEVLVLCCAEGTISIQIGCDGNPTEYKVGVSDRPFSTECPDNIGLVSVVQVTLTANTPIFFAYSNELEGVRPSTCLAPSGSPSLEPSVSGLPTTTPSSMPSSSPSTLPSRLPTVLPSSLPSTQPSVKPSLFPSLVPSSSPSVLPSRLPSFVPSSAPSMSPSVLPSGIPSSVPTSSPTGLPSSLPSITPSAAPSSAPNACGDEWTCFDGNPLRDVSIGFQDPGAGSDINPPSTCPDNLADSNVIRVQRSELVNVIISVPCCATGVIEVCRLCSDGCGFIDLSPAHPVVAGQLPSIYYFGLPDFIVAATTSCVDSDGNLFGPTIPVAEIKSVYPNEAFYVRVPSPLETNGMDPLGGECFTPSSMPSTAPSSAPSSSPTSCFNGQWTCFEEAVDYGFSITRVGHDGVPGSESCPIDPPTIASPVRVQQINQGSIKINVPCCSVGTISVSQGCMDTDLEVITFSPNGVGPAEDFPFGGSPIGREVSTSSCEPGDDPIAVAEIRDVPAFTPLFVSTINFNQGSCGPMPSVSLAPSSAPSSMPTVECVEIEPGTPITNGGISPFQPIPDSNLFGYEVTVGPYDGSSPLLDGNAELCSSDIGESCSFNRLELDSSATAFIVTVKLTNLQCLTTEASSIDVRIASGSGGCIVSSGELPLHNIGDTGELQFAAYPGMTYNYILTFHLGSCIS